jgi:hypothetical protein
MIKKQLPFAALTAAFFTVFSFTLQAQSFTLSEGILPSELHSGGTVGFTDMDGDGRDDIVVFDGAEDVYVLYQMDSGLEEVHYGSLSNSNQWGACIGDVDNDGKKDIFSGGHYDGAHLVRITNMDPETGAEFIELDSETIYMQATNMADINMDGWLDVFACHDDGLSLLFGNDGAGELINDPALMPLTSYDHDDYPDTDHSGNYGTVWSDVDGDGDTDFYLAKCRQFVSDELDPRRVNQLWINDGEGNYTEEANERGLVFFEQSWTADFGDVDNDGDMDCFVTNHSTSLILCENDGTGHFTNITEGSGIDVSGFFLQGKMEDFDNDGFLDILTSGGDESNHYFQGHGDGTFTELDWPFSYPDRMNTFSIGDYERNGQIDVYAGHGSVYVSADSDNPDKLYINDGNENNWVAFDLLGTVSNASAVGAIVHIYGPWGDQVREVRAGESYGISCSSHPHFGLGAATAIDSALVIWPSGLTTELTNPAINVYHNLIEGPCQFDAPAIAAAGTTTLCPGESLTLTAPEGLASYSWSNGSTGSSTEVSSTGNYYVIMETAEGCLGQSAPISVIVYTPELPTITVDGNLKLCEGQSVTLISSSAPSYNWSNDDLNQSILVNEAGTYFVSIDGECTEPLTSASVEVEVFETPAAPTVEGVSIDAGETATLDGGMENLQWFSDATTSDLLYEGNPFTTPVLNEDQSYWAASILNHGLETAVGGASDPSTEGQFQESTYYYLTFDAYQDIVIRSAKVIADGAGERTVVVQDPEGAVLDEVTVMIPDGESIVELNLEVEAGTDYGLRVTTTPNLWRDGLESELNYPYEIGTLASVTGTSVGNPQTTLSYYYFFYDITVETQAVACLSDAVEVVVSVVVSVDHLEGIAGLEVYPNPSRGEFTLRLPATAGKLQAEVLSNDGRSVWSKNYASAAEMTRLDLSGLAPGAYVLRLVQGNRVATAHVVIR